MDDNLLGYLLNSLEPDEQRQVEEYLRTHPDAASKLERLRQALAPLSADADPPVPSPNLVIGTFALVAEMQCRPVRPPARPPVPKKPRPSDWSWLRRPDFLAAALAASILLALVGLAVGLVSTAVVHVRQQEQNVACQNNLHKWWQALEQYSDKHQNRFPAVEPSGAHGIAGVFVPLLNDGGLVTKDMSIGCPAQGFQPAPTCHSMRDLEKMYLSDPNGFQAVAPTLAKDYAYSLGYMQNGQLYGWLRTSGDLFPILADRPPFGLGNSPNHDGLGQNVLYIGGNVRFCTERTVGVALDDIYLSKNGLLEAGVNDTDTVLGPSEATPYARHCSW